MEHDNYVDFYTEGMVKMRICFPHGKVDCRHCRFQKYREAIGLFQCALTDELIEKIHIDGRHEHCPIEIQETPF